MAIIIYKDGTNKWYKDTLKAATSVGTPQTQKAKQEIREMRTEECSMKVLRMYNDGIITEAELDDAIAKNAFGIGADPDQHREAAQRLLDAQENISKDIEKE